MSTIEYYWLIDRYLWYPTDWVTILWSKAMENELPMIFRTSNWRTANEIARSSYTSIIGVERGWSSDIYIPGGTCSNEFLSLSFLFNSRSLQRHQDMSQGSFRWNCLRFGDVGSWNQMYPNVLCHALRSALDSHAKLDDLGHMSPKNRLQ